MLGRLGWSQAKGARVLYIDRNDDDDEEAIRRFEKTFNKHLTRVTTKPTTLQGYLNDLRRSHDAKKAGLIHNHYVSTGELTPKLERAMRRISTELNEWSVDEDE